VLPHAQIPITGSCMRRRHSPAIALFLVESSPHLKFKSWRDENIVDLMTNEQGKCVDYMSLAMDPYLQPPYRDTRR
jgi:hypothetical protein